jgi:hypothetical protein
MKNGTFKFLAELEENGELRIKIEAETNPIAALKALEKIDREVKRMRKHIFSEIEKDN